MITNKRARLGLALILAALLLPLVASGPWLYVVASLLYGPGWFLLFFAVRRTVTATTPDTPDYAALAAEAEQVGMPTSAGLWRLLADLDERIPEPEPEPIVMQVAARVHERHQQRLAALAHRTDQLRAELADAGPASPAVERYNRRRILDSAREDAARARMRESLRPATPEEYGKWLAGWAARGGRVNRYDYPMARWAGGPSGPGVWLATRDLHVEPLHGSSALGIILVPRGVKVTGSEPGHTDVVWTQSDRTLGFHGVPSRVAPAFTDVPVVTR